MDHTSFLSPKRLVSLSHYLSLIMSSVRSCSQNNSSLASFTSPRLFWYIVDELHVLLFDGSLCLALQCDAMLQICRSIQSSTCIVGKLQVCISVYQLKGTKSTRTLQFIYILYIMPTLSYTIPYYSVL